MIDTRTADEIGVGSKSNPENSKLKSPERLAPSMRQIYEAIFVRHIRSLEGVITYHRPHAAGRLEGAPRVTAKRVPT